GGALLREPADSLSRVHLRARARSRVASCLPRGHRPGGSRVPQPAAQLRPGPCAGVFHDYWISLRGADGTTAPRRTMSSRTVCDGRLTYIRPCWYRYFLEQPVEQPVGN